MFRVAAYDRSKSLVIDPTLSYSTYLGGNDYDSALRFESKAMPLEQRKNRRQGSGVMDETDCSR